MKYFWALALSLLIGSTAVGAQVRSASEKEIAEALIGCWEQEPTREDIHFAKSGYFNKRNLCFGPLNVAKASWVGVDPFGTESSESEGSYRLEDGKLLLTGGDEWPLGFYKASCDVVMRLGVAMQFRNCVDGDGRPVASSSYFRADE